MERTIDIYASKLGDEKLGMFEGPIMLHQLCFTPWIDN